jgi:1-pyrroline-5-carboxylate dehydrogenase
MSTALPRVTYSNIGVDFSSVHDHLDTLLSGFEARTLGREWLTPYATGPMREIVSPIDPGILLGRFRDSTPEDVAAAVGAARAAFPGWSAISRKDRLVFANRWREALGSAKFQLALAALYEIGKSRMEAMGEAEEASDIVEYYAGELVRRNWYQQKMNELVANETAQDLMRPYGVFGIIAPFNFPVALTVNMVAGALLTGNTVVYKPSPNCALTGLLIAETLADAGLPAGAFNVVLGGASVGEMILTQPDLSGVAFTGSHKTGMHIFRYMASQNHMKPVIAEMGGKNPAYVTCKANIVIAAEGVARSAFGLQGQKCSACSVVYVEQDIKDNFVAALTSFAEKLVVGDPRLRSTFMGPVYGQATVTRYSEAVEEARRSGAIHFGGQALGKGLPNNYLLPTVVELPAPGRLTREELFMPFVVVRSFASLASALAEGNAVQYGLTAGIYSDDKAEIALFLDKAEAGVLYANRASGATTGAWPGSQPFCGWKGTGVSGKGGLGPNFLPQFMREQSHTIMQQSRA